MMQKNLLVGGKWQNSLSGATQEITSPYDSRVVGTVAVANAKDVENAIAAAEKGAKVWSQTPAYERADILFHAAELLDKRAEEIAKIISAENGKIITEAISEAKRAGDILRVAIHEGTQLYGSSLPLDANRGTDQDKIGFTLRQPVGIVAAISPFNYPSLLVMHKIAPALASGNAVILKPAGATPLTALLIAECFIEAGLPDGVLSVLTGPGKTIGDTLTADSRIRKISFTGSTAVGEHITSIAGVKKLSLELGSSAPVVILPDANLELAASAVAAGGYINAGQVCISVQRVIVHSDVADEFVKKLTAHVKQHRTGDPSNPQTTIGTLISETEAIRVEKMIRDAVEAGATLITGGQRKGAIIEPAILTDVDPNHAIAQEEIFGPVVAISTATDIDDAFKEANNSKYGLAAGIFTQDVNQGIRATREFDTGVVHINWTPLWRADLMPYGGFKASGIGKEGMRSAVSEMTEEKTIILHGSPWN